MERKKLFVLVPVEIETCPSLDGEEETIGTIRMPNEKDIKKSMDVVVPFEDAPSAWRHLFDSV